MEVVSAINARLVEYEHDLRRIEKDNHLRLRRGESSPKVGRGLAGLFK